MDHKREEKSFLNEIRAEIDERAMVYIFADGSGDIEAEMDGKPFDLEIGDWQPIYQSIISQSPDSLGDLRVSEMVQIAKILSLAKDRNYDITFASESMESLYEHMKNVCSVDSAA